jgi:CRP-like cAMP-binding protein
MIDAGAMAATDLRIDPGLLSELPFFRGFTQTQVELLAQSMHRLDLDEGTLLFAEGDEGGSCFVVLEGVVDVSVKVRAQPQLLAQLGAASIFGQLSVIEGEPRNASCSIHRHAVLGELNRDACARLLSDDSPIALQLLGALNQGLVEALRGADRHLMRLEMHRESSHTPTEWTTASRLA